MSRGPRRRWRRPLAWLVLAGLVLVGLRLAVAAEPAPRPLATDSSRLVVVGLTGRTQLDATDRAVIDRASRDGRRVQVGAVSVRPRYLGACATAGWATLGAGRRADVGGLCHLQVSAAGVVDHWSARRAAAQRDDADLGTLAGVGSAGGGACIAAVGPGAALAAARPDGTTAAYQSVTDYLARGLVSGCPVTIVDPGAHADAVISAAARLADTTVVVTGIGPMPGSHDPALQVIYRLGGGPSGWLTSPSTRRTGVVTLTDLTRTIVDFARRGTAGAGVGTAPMDGAPVEALPAPVDAAALTHHLATITALVTVPQWMFVEMACAGLAAAVVLAVAIRRRRWDRVAGVLAAVSVCPVTMMLVGATRWWRAGAPLPALSLAFWLLLAALVAVAFGLARDRRSRSVAAAGDRSDRPLMSAAAAVSAALFTAEAVAGGFAEQGSLLDSRPTVGGRWYGFGNVTFAAYASATLVVAGMVAAALPTRPGRRIPGLWRSSAVLVIGLVLVICEGWPTMGADFGGVVGFAPVALWLALAVSGLRPRWWAYPLIGIAAAAAVVGLSVLDWLRPPQSRTHIGRFVQRVVDGDATDIIVSKARLMVHSVVMPLGLLALAVGIGVWWALFRYVLPRTRLLAGPEPDDTERRMVRRVAVAVLATAVLGTVVNDGGIVVWTTVTGCFGALTSLALAEHSRARAWSTEPNERALPQTPLASQPLPSGDQPA